MNLPDDLKYTEEHEWVRVEDGVAVVGITDYAQGELGDIVFLEMPQVGDSVKIGGECGAIEAVKTVAQLFAPVSGAISETNAALERDASLVNRDPYGEGWIFKIKVSDPGELEGLLTADGYRSLVS
jgi:glycine cleavage system H protein